MTSQDTQRPEITPTMGPKFVLNVLRSLGAFNVRLKLLKTFKAMVESNY